jgi:hypothetical protein
VKVFDLSDPKDVELLTEIEDKVANELWIRLHKDEIVYDEEKKNWRLLVRWGVIKGDIPPNIMRMAAGQVR